jgi:hypothetical protein
MECSPGATDVYRKDQAAGPEYCVLTTMIGDEMLLVWVPDKPSLLEYLRLYGPIAWLSKLASVPTSAERRAARQRRRDEETKSRSREV